ncbi:MAG: cupin domain-containing protein [Candidatus Sedimenticola endophacoides]
MKLILPDPLTPQRFLDEYWQKRPLLMRGALLGYTAPVQLEELARLACEAEIESRLVLEKDGNHPWQARQGPFDAEDFASLPPSHWTLLVQDLDKHLPEAADLLEPFRFIPDWRLDDIMISYAADQGSVGPHIDDYDVFLIQARGVRRWMIHTQEVSEDDYIPDLDLRILPAFEAEHDWLLEPGDVLYLPPNVAHWGIAQGDGCMTCSVGFRAPTLQEMVAAWSDELIRELIPAGRYRDPPLSLQRDNGEIRPDALAHVRSLLDQVMEIPAGRRDRWFGRFITEPKGHLLVVPCDQPLAPGQFASRFEQAGELERNGWSRLAFIRGGEGYDYLYASGDEYPIPHSLAGFAEWISAQRRLPFSEALPWLRNPEGAELMARLHNDGHLQLPDA